MGDDVARSGAAAGVEHRPWRVVSGGQTGVDRGALQAARRTGRSIGGWCPLGRRAEDGRVPDEYPLVELTSPDYAVRTEQNVLDSDATLVLHRGTVTGGTKLTVQMAAKHSRPCLEVNLDHPAPLDEVWRWLDSNAVDVLNCAGPRESVCPGIEVQSRDWLTRLFRRLI